MPNNILLYRFVIFNALCFILTGYLTWTGYVPGLFAADRTHITVVIAVLFIVAWFFTLRAAIYVNFGWVDPDFKLKMTWLWDEVDLLPWVGLLGTLVGIRYGLAGFENDAGTAASAKASGTTIFSGVETAITTSILGSAGGIWLSRNMRMISTALELRK